MSQGNQGNAYAAMSSGGNSIEEANSVTGSTIGHTTNLAGQHILHLLRGGGNNKRAPTETSVDAHNEEQLGYSEERAPMEGSSS
mmetsp:Transcript_18616/g.15529  ORF Transcript_18616/g.15529 Transcript_18616/m.15529 type:complete len:84 (-) Transcript_18616:19-270(-)